MSTTGLRERKKLETRAALRSAALALTAAHGLDRVTIEDIAEAAHVSPRTFFNYFPNKEDAVIGVESEGLEEILALLSTRPIDEEPLFSLHAVLRVMATASDRDRELHVLRMKVIADNPTLLPRHVARFAEFERVLVQALRDRTTTPRTSDADPALVVASAVAALRVSVDLWIAGEGKPDLPVLLDSAINHLAVGLVSPKDRRAIAPTTAHDNKKSRKDLR